MGPCDRLSAPFREAAQRLGSGQVEWHGEHVMDDETVEFFEERTRAVFAGLQETKVGLSGTAVVGLFLGGSDQGLL